AQGVGGGQWGCQRGRRGHGGRARKRSRACRDLRRPVFLGYCARHGIVAGAATPCPGGGQLKRLDSGGPAKGTPPVVRHVSQSGPVRFPGPRRKSIARLGSSVEARRRAVAMSGAAAWFAPVWSESRSKAIDSSSVGATTLLCLNADPV